MKIYVGNLDLNLTEADLRSMFEPFGTLDSVALVTDRDTGRSRGFGFVEMGNNAEANAAMTSLNGKEVGGRALTVNEARPKAGGDFRRSGGRGDQRGRQRNSRW